MWKRAAPVPRLPRRDPDAHKGDFGSVLVIGGSRGMAGAPALAGQAGLRSGAGLVRVAAPQGVASIVAGFDPAYMTLPLPEDESGGLATAARDALSDLVDRVTCIACGPGLGRSPQAADLVLWLYQLAPCPVVFDADALWPIAQRLKRLEMPPAPRVLTPHPGEFRQFVDGQKLARGPAEEAAHRLADHCHATLVLKGHHTFVTDGRQTFHNTTGNPGMATGGSGDVLTGVIAALIGQKLAAYDAACLGVHVHGLAGDLAAVAVGQVSLTANDLIDYLPSAFVKLESER